ncbi:MAG: hypothetical protein PHY66_10160 [Aliarcobacter sp.]|nr:hypothetical protein [Aliarcobacter sp.]
MNNEIIININEANKAQKYQKKEELFQIEAFEKVSKILHEHNVGNNTNDITDCRFHDTIFIDGDRGVGKTAFMINIENYYKKYFTTETAENKNENKGNFIFLKPVDPTLLEHTEKFLGVVFGKIVEIVSMRLKNNSIDENSYYFDDDCNIKSKFENQTKHCIDSYYRALENLSKSLGAVSSIENKQSAGIEEIASYKSSLKLEQYAHEFFQVVCKMFGVNAIVMLIDDVDMAFDKGFDVLEVVRKYLASPYLIPIVAGDMKLYREIVETKFIEKIKFYEDVKYMKDLDSKFIESKEYKDKLQLLNNLVKQYLHKIFPNEYRIELKNIFRIIRENLVTVKLGNLDIPFTEIKDFEIRHLNFGINQKQFTFKVFEDNTRKVIQYLTSKKEIYSNFFRNIDYSKNAKYESYLPQKVMVKYDEFIVSFIQTIYYKKSLEITYNILQDEKDNKLSEFLANDLNSKYLMSDELRNILQYKEKESRDFVIQYTNLKDILKVASTHQDLENYILNLFIYNDYIKGNHHQTKNYIYSGKFIQCMIFSLFIKEKIELNTEEIQLILNKIQSIDLDFLINNGDYEIYSMIFNDDSEYFKTQNIDIDFLELSFIINSVPFNSSKIDDKSDNNNGIEEEVVVDYKTFDLSKDLILWKNIFAKNLILNSTTLYRILDKFYENLSYMKNQKLNDSPLEFLQRIVLIFINSVAFFESTNLKIANTNIAIGDKFDLTIALTKTNAATLNIKPLMNKELTLTKALFFHPIISHILFPNNDSKLKSLSFTNLMSDLKDKKDNEDKKELFNNIFYKYWQKIGHYKRGLPQMMNPIDICKNYFREINKNIDNNSKKFLTVPSSKYVLTYKFIKENVSDKDNELETLMKKYQDLVTK